MGPKFHWDVQLVWSTHLTAFEDSLEHAVTAPDGAPGHVYPFAVRLGSTRTAETRRPAHTRWAMNLLERIDVQSQQVKKALPISSMMYLEKATYVIPADE